MLDRWKAWAEGFKQGRLAAEKGHSMKKCPYERSDSRRKGFRRGLRYERHIQDQQEREALEQAGVQSGFRLQRMYGAKVLAVEATRKPQILRDLKRIYKPR